ncbi:MAG: metallophosphoesterase [Myxococcales bacterium]|nr:metallophosphoesterase [Myxococcales bacterium]MCB9579921.1 metallophosphoesterase [Polyangiaceae bacterium]
MDSLSRPVLAATLLVASSCLRFTPFSTEPSERDLTQKNLARIAAQEQTLPFSFVALGDTHDGYDELSGTVKAINARNDIRFVVVAGDMSDRSLLGEFELTQARLGDIRVPVLTVIGNHDAIADGPEIYRKMYGPLNYTFSYAGTKFVMFNSNSLEFPHVAPDREWLTKETQSREGAERLIWVTHQPVYAPADIPNGGSKEFYRQLLEAEPVDLVVHGHLLDYALGTYEGTTLLQCSTHEYSAVFTVVTVAETSITFSRCHYDDCESVTPASEMPE